eukprot:gene1947-5035_t
MKREDQTCIGHQQKQFYRHRDRLCRLCNGEKYIGWFWSRQLCPACYGQGHVSLRQRKCPGCQGEGKSGLWLLSSPCKTCMGQRWLEHKRGYIAGKQHNCIMCCGRKRISSGIFGTKSCPACLGHGLVVGPQHKCNSCDGSGLRLNQTCPLCQGRCFVSFEQMECSECRGTGRHVSFLSSRPCTACDEAGFIPVRSITVITDSENEQGHLPELNANTHVIFSLLRTIRT